MMMKWWHKSIKLGDFQSGDKSETSLLRSSCCALVLASAEALVFVSVLILLNLSDRFISVNHRICMPSHSLVSDVCT